MSPRARTSPACAHRAGREAEPLAVVLLAHADPAQVHRLIRALPGVPVFLHCDARTPPPVFRAMTTGLPAHVTVVDRVRTALASWSLVRAELTGLRAAVRAVDARHVVVLSGACYPLMSVDDLVRELAVWRGRSWIANTPLPVARWSTPRHPDGGLWRLNRRYLVHRDRVLHLRGVPLRWPWPRTVPAELELRAGGHWKIYSGAHARLLLDLVDDRPDLLRFWRTTLIPEETFVPTMLASPALAGADALPPCDAGPWYIDWAGSPDGHHPPWLTGADVDRLKVARWAPPLTPAAPPDPAGTRRLFARKFRSADPDVLDRIDAELRR
ncbi:MULTISPECIES: beta-1,6-N-acetylglucosaminyltransferase [Catenuloplanes]|uniref:Core-2/I-Branching enzyme n=1 Tax=Catenuloplanes niger TaxID=587534 RepID=A0AAE4CTK2_9ACTN|nr:beta-1,6-N-acetylglucosaminyltransferase [Catenuloplanes niger]MDR7322348.1 hypothetical protein [Catenuloplanes niger]